MVLVESHHALMARTLQGELMNRIAAAIFLAVLIILCSQSGSAQRRQKRSDDLKKLREEVKSLKTGQEAMQKDLQEIKKLLEVSVGAVPPPTPILEAISVGDNPFLGNKNARVVLLDFSDYQCPFCGRFVRETMPQLEQEYIKTGKVKYVFRDLPIESIHPFALKAAEAVRCAGEQNTYWEMHYRLYQNQNALDTGSMPAHVQALGMNLPAFTTCLNSGKYATGIRKDIADASAAGISGTPTFVVGLVNTRNPNDGNIKVLQQIIGAQPFEVFKSALEKALAAANK
jgi:protein-disulfide isomerase